MKKTGATQKETKSCNEEKTQKQKKKNRKKKSKRKRTEENLQRANLTRARPSLIGRPARAAPEAAKYACNVFVSETWLLETPSFLINSLLANWIRVFLFLKKKIRRIFLQNKMVQWAHMSASSVFLENAPRLFIISGRVYI